MKSLTTLVLLATLCLFAANAHAQGTPDDGAVKAAPKTKHASSKPKKAKKSKKSAKAAPAQKAEKPAGAKSHFLTPVEPTPSAAGSKGARLKPDARLSRDIVFDGSNVGGQYHSAGEAVAKVEQEKKMNNLVGIRKDFKDRLADERQRVQQGDVAAKE